MLVGMSNFGPGTDISMYTCICASLRFIGFLGIYIYIYMHYTTHSPDTGTMSLVRAAETQPEGPIIHVYMGLSQN